MFNFCAPLFLYSTIADKVWLDKVTDYCDIFTLGGDSSLIEEGIIGQVAWCGVNAAKSVEKNTVTEN